MKNTFRKIFTAFLLTVMTIMLVLISACKFTSFSYGSEYANITEFFRDYTENAAIEKYDSFQFNKDKYDVMCIPSSSDLHVVFTMRNPVNFVFNEETLKVELPDNGFPVNGSMVNIYQDEENHNLVHLIYSQEYLYRTDMGKDISPAITLINPKNKVVMPVYNGLKIKSNSPPPSVYKPVVYTNDVNGNEEYVLIFNMPSTGMLSSNHKDVKTLEVKNTVTGEFDEFYDISINDDGTFDISGKNISQFTTKEQSLEDLRFNVLGATFEERGQAVYIKTGEHITTEDYVYKFILTDADGLTNESQASVKSVRLYPITVSNIKGEILNDGDKVEQDDGDSYATVSFKPAPVTYWYVDSENQVVNKFIWYEDGEGNVYDSQNAEQTLILHSEYLQMGTGGELLNRNVFPESVVNSWKLNSADTSDASITYEIYQGKDDTGRVLFNGKNNGGEISLKLPAGNLFVRIYAHLTGFADTTTREFGMEVLKATLFVSENGDDIYNNGSSNSPFATINHALSELSFQELDKNTVYLFSDVDENVSVELHEDIIHPSEFMYTKISSVENQHYTINGDLAIGENCTVVLHDVDINGNITLASSAKLILSGSVNIRNGSVILKGDDSGNGIILLRDDYVLPETRIEIIMDPLVINSMVLVQENGYLSDVIIDDINNDKFKYVVLNNGGYYIYIETDDKTKDTYKCGVVRKSGATIHEPEIGGFKVELMLNDAVLEAENNIYKLSANSRVYANIIKENTDKESSAGLSNVSIILEQEGDIIVRGTADSDKENTVAMINLPEISGKYILRVNFIYDGITYSESFIVKLEKQGAR